MYRTYEQLAARYLQTLGHEILHRNHKCGRSEVDIISVYQNALFLSEIKYRRKPPEPLEDVLSNAQIQRIIHCGASLLANSTYSELHCLLLVYHGCGQGPLLQPINVS